MPNKNTRPICASPVCDRQAIVRGMCNGHYLRLRKGLPTDTPLRLRGAPLDVRIRAGSKQDANGCWIWQNGRNVKGYGTMGVGQKHKLAHRVSYEVVNGKIPDGLVMDHLCRNPSCVNPAHLEAVTSRENALRGIGPTAINAKKTHCNRGHPLSGDNLYRYPSGGRQCRTCIAMHRHKRSAKMAKGSA